jgi:hypothetical protein
MRTGGELLIPAPRQWIPRRTRSSAASPQSLPAFELIIDIGAAPILLRTESRKFADMLKDRYGSFVSPHSPRAVVDLYIRLIPPRPMSDAEEMSVRRVAGGWVMERGDFHAVWVPQAGRGVVRQTANPYSIDSVLRILHSLILAREGGMLVHGAGAVRNGRAFVFAGVSGTGKTTLARLAPPDVTLLTDEISYIRPSGRGTECRESGVGTRTARGTSGTDQTSIPASQFPMTDSETRYAKPESRASAFEAFGTPFAGELARNGDHVRAPLAGLFLLQQGPENRVEVLKEGEAVRELMRHILFFAHDEELTQMIFETACDFVKHVPVRRLVFTPDARVWELIA